MVTKLATLQDEFSSDVFISAGFTSQQVLDNNLSNACATRLSIALNAAGDPVSAGYGFRPKRDNIITSVHTMSKYLEAAYGPPDIEWPYGSNAKMNTKMVAKQGIVLFLGANGAPGASHATAWKLGDKTTIDGANTTGNYRVLVWVF